MGKLINLGLVYGGKSVERKISFQSAKSISEGIDKNKYKIFLLEIDKKNRWFFVDSLTNSKKIQITLINNCNKIKIDFFKTKKKTIEIDVFFPIIHGSYGEDGSIQGMFEILGAPYVGSGVIGSALGMDKDIQKRLLNQAGIKTAKFSIIIKNPINKYDLKKVMRKFNLPVFIKPANLGSSIGITKVNNTNQLKNAIDKAFKYDNKILIEESIDGYEIECGVLGNDSPIASLPGEIIIKDKFYTYRAKYSDKKGGNIIILDNRSKKIVDIIQKTAIETFLTLECNGMARVDFFLSKTGKLFVNEINTLPAIARTSTFVKLFEAAGVSYSRLLDTIIDLAFKKKLEKDLLLRNFSA